MFACHINYGIMLWGYSSDKVSKLQKKVIRSISNAHRIAHVDPLLKELGILRLHDILILQEYKFFYKFINNLLPNYLQSLLQPFEKRHNFNTRSDLILQPVYTRLTTLSRTLRVQIVKNVNNAPTQIVEKVYTHSYDGFCTYIKKYLVSLYPTECTESNCYVCNQLQG